MQLASQTPGRLGNRCSLERFELVPDLPSDFLANRHVLLATSPEGSPCLARPSQQFHLACAVAMWLLPFGPNSKGLSLFKKWAFQKRTPKKSCLGIDICDKTLFPFTLTHRNLSGFSWFSLSKARYCFSPVGVCFLRALKPRVFGSNHPARPGL